MKEFDAEKKKLKKRQLCELRHFSLHVFKRGYDCAMIGHSSCFYGILK